MATSRFRRGTLTVDPPGSPHVCGQWGPGGRTMGSLKGGVGLVAPRDVVVYAANRSALCMEKFRWRQHQIHMNNRVILLFCYSYTSESFTLCHRFLYLSCSRSRSAKEQFWSCASGKCVHPPCLISKFQSPTLGYFFTVTTLGFPRYMCDNGLPHVMQGFTGLDKVSNT